MIGVECWKAVAAAHGVAAWLASMNVCTRPPGRLPSGRSQFTRRTRRRKFDVPRQEISPAQLPCSPAFGLASVRQHTWVLGTCASHPAHAGVDQQAHLHRSDTGAVAKVSDHQPLRQIADELPDEGSMRQAVKSIALKPPDCSSLAMGRAAAAAPHRRYGSAAAAPAAMHDAVPDGSCCRHAGLGEKAAKTGARVRLVRHGGRLGALRSPMLLPGTDQT